MIISKITIITIRMNEMWTNDTEQPQNVGFFKQFPIQFEIAYAYP